MVSQLIIAADRAFVYHSKILLYLPHISFMQHIIHIFLSSSLIFHFLFTLNSLHYFNYKPRWMHHMKLFSNVQNVMLQVLLYHSAAHYALAACHSIY